MLHRSRLPLAAGALFLLAACDGTRTTAAPDPDLPPASSLTQLECTAEVASGAVRCGEPAPAAAGSANLLYGGQGTMVRLASSNTSYDSATQVFRSDVTVQNLLMRAIGTTDGTTLAPGGVRVFFLTGPSRVGGSGAVSLANPDGTAAFTTSAQKYFQYDAVLDSGEVSAPKTWRFNVAPTVASFRFTVAISAPLPHESAIISVRRYAAPQMGFAHFTWDALDGYYFGETGVYGFKVAGVGWADGLPRLFRMSSTQYGRSVSLQGTLTSSDSLHAVYRQWESDQALAVGGTGSPQGPLVINWHNGAPVSTSGLPVGLGPLWAVTGDGSHYWAAGDGYTLRSGSPLRLIDAGALPAHPTAMTMHNTLRTPLLAGYTGSSGMISSLRGDTLWVLDTIPAGTPPVRAIRDTFAVADGGIVLRRTSTHGWTPFATAVGDSLVGVWSGIQDLYVIGSSGKLHHWDGSTWMVVYDAGRPVRAFGGAVGMGHQLWIAGEDYFDVANR